MSDGENTERKADPPPLTGRARSLANLRPPWKKGQPSANPGGRPKGIAAQIRDLSKDGKLIIEQYWRIWQGLEPGFNAAARLEAGKLLMERGFGKTPDVALTGQLSEEATQAAQSLTTEDLLELVRTPPADPPPPTDDEQAA